MADVKDLSNPENQKPKKPSLGFSVLDREIKANQVMKPTVHKGVDVQSYLDYTGSDINLLTDDAEKIRANNQSGWEQAGAFLNQAVIGEIVGGSIEGLGYLLDFKGMADIAKGTESEWGNWLSDGGKALREMTQEVTPIYQEDPGTFNPTDSGWWFGNGVSVASTLSLMIPSGLALKGITTAGRALGRLGKATATGRKLLQQGSKIAARAQGTKWVAENAAKGVGQAFLSRHAENMMEASSTFEEKYEQLIDKGLSEEQARQRASDGASTVYKLNSAMILQDIAQYTLLHALKMRIKPNEAGKVAGSFAEKLPGGKYTALAADFAGEAAEESYQYVVAEEAKYMVDVAAGLRDQSDFSDRLKAYTADGEFQTSAFFGGFGSLLMQTAGPALMNKLEGRTGGFTNDPLGDIRDEFARMSQANQAINAAGDQGLAEQVDYLNSLNVVEQSIRNADREKGDIHLQALREFENMSDEDIEEYVAEKGAQGITIDPDSIRETATRNREIAEQTLEKHQQLKDTYGKEVAGRATRNYMDAVINKQKRDQKAQELTEHKSKIPQYDNLSPQGQARVDLDMEEAGLDRAEKNLTKLISEVESDEVLSSRYQQALQNVKEQKELLKQRRKALKEEEYSKEDRTNDKQERQGIDPYVKEGAKIISQGKLASEVSKISNAAYNEIVSIAGDKAEAKKKKAKAKEEFEKNTTPVDSNEPYKKGDKVMINGEPGRYEGWYAGNDGKKKHKITKLLDPKRTKSILSDEELDEKVHRRKSGQEIADEQAEEKRVDKSAEEQTKVYNTKRQPKKKDPKEKTSPEEGQLPTDRFPPPVGEKRPTEGLTEEQRQRAEEGDIPLIYSDEQEANDADDVASSQGNAGRDAGGNEDIQPSPNAATDENTPSGYGKTFEVKDGVQATNASIHNPKHPASKNDPESAEYKRDAIWTEWAETPVSIQDENGYAYQVQTRINTDFASDDVTRKVENGDVLTADEIDQLGIELDVIDAETGEPITINGEPVTTFLKTASSVRNKGLDQAADKLANEREKIYAIHLDGGTAVAPIIDKTAGYFAPDPNADIGDFSTLNPVTQVLGQNASEVDLSISDGVAYTGSNGQPKLDIQASGGTPGAVYATVTSANGSTRPMRLMISPFTEQESELVYRLYEDMILNQKKPQATLSESTADFIANSPDPRVRALSDLFNLNDLSNADLLGFLVFNGKDQTFGTKEAQLWRVAKGKASSLRYSTNGNIRVSDFESGIKKAQFKNWLRANRLHQIQRKLIDNNDYKNYLLTTSNPEQGIEPILKTNQSVLPDNKVNIAPVFTMGNFGEATQMGDIDHVESANKKPYSQMTREEVDEANREINRKSGKSGKFVSKSNLNLEYPNPYLPVRKDGSLLRLGTRSDDSSIFTFKSPKGFNISVTIEERTTPQGAPEGIYLAVFGDIDEVYGKHTAYSTEEGIIVREYFEGLVGQEIFQRNEEGNPIGILTEEGKAFMESLPVDLPFNERPQLIIQDYEEALSQVKKGRSEADKRASFKHIITNYTTSPLLNWQETITEYLGYDLRKKYDVGMDKPPQGYYDEFYQAATEIYEEAKQTIKGSPRESRRDPDDDIEMGDVWQRRQMSNASTLPDAMGERGMVRMLDRLKERFNVNYQIINDPDVEWAGKVEAGTVFINTAHATLDTPFHEFAHPLIEQIKRNNVRLYMNLSDELRNSPQGKRIMRRVERNYPDLNAEQRMDEAIVQAIGELAADNIVEDQSKFRRFVREMWATIKRMMRKLLGQDITVDPYTLSPTTSLGQISEMLSNDMVSIDLTGTFMTREQRPDWMSQQEYVDWVDSMTYMFIRSNMTDDISDISGANMRSILTLVEKQYERMDDSNPMKESYGRVIDDISMEDGSLSPDSKLLLAVQRRLKTYGIVPSQEVSEQEADSSLNIRANYEFSNKDKASINVKLMVSTIPKLKSAKKVDNKFGKNKPDYELSPHTGLPKFNNFSDMWNVLQRNLSNVVEMETETDVEDIFDKFISRLKEASVLRPELTSLIESLENAPEWKKTEFTQVMSMAPQNFSSTFFYKVKDNFYYRIGDSDTQSVAEKIIDVWDSQFRSELGVTMTGKESGKIALAMDSDKASNLVNRYKSLVDEATNASRKGKGVPVDLKEKFQSLLQDTGIGVSMRTVDKLIYDSKKGKNPIDKFRQMLVGSKESSIRYIYTGGKLSIDKAIVKNEKTDKKNQIIIPDGPDTITTISDEGFVDTIAEAEGYFQNQLADSTVLGPENKPFWMYSTYNSMYKKVAEWRQGTDGLSQILSAPYNKHSQWGQWLLESQENRDNFELINFMNFKQLYYGDQGRKGTDMGLTDLLADKLNRTLKGIFALPARADNTTEYMVKGPAAKKSFRITDDNRLELRDSAVKTIKEYLLDEVARIKHATAQIENLPENEWVRDYHYKLNDNGEKDTSLGNAFKIHLMPSFNPLTEAEQAQLDEGTLERQDNSHFIFDSRGDTITLTNNNWYNNDQLSQVIRDSFERQFNRDLEKMVSSRVIRKVKGKYENNAIDAKKMKNYYTKGDVSENLGVQAAIMDYTFNGIIANQEWHKLFGGDIASYKNRADFQKRATGPGSTGLVYRIQSDMDKSYNSAVVNDIETPSDLISKESIKAIAEYTGRTQKEVAKLLEPYNRVDRTDAQAWITPSAYRDRMRGYGKWSDEHEFAYQRLQEGKSLPQDLKMFMQPLKTVHTEQRIQQGNSIFHYNKQSEAVLHPQLAEALDLGNLLEAMEAQNVDHVVVESGKKVGAQGITDVIGEDGNVLSPDDLKLNSVSLSKRFLFLQQELPTKGMKPSKEGSQIRKNIFEGIVDDADYTVAGKTMTGKEFRAELHQAIGSLSDKGLQEVKDFIGWNEESETYDQDKMRAYLIDAFTKRDADENLIEALDMKMKISGVKRHIPLDAIPQMRISIENQIATIINKRAVDLKHETGGNYIQMSDLGWTTSLEGSITGPVTWINEDAKSGLKPPRIENGEFKPGQVLLPHKIAKQLKLEGKDLSTVLSEISVGVSYRIPNQSMSSNDVIEVAGILPEEMGDTVVVYKETTTKFGSDFDIDKLSIMLPNYKIVDGEVVVDKFHDIDTNDEAQLEEVYKSRFGTINPEVSSIVNRIAADAKARIDANDWGDIFTGFSEEDSARTAIRNILARETDLSFEKREEYIDNMFSMSAFDLLNVPSMDEFIEQHKGGSVYAVNSKEAVQNRKLDMYKAMLSNPETYMQMIAPLDNDWLKNAIRNHRLGADKTYTEDFEAFSPTTQVEIRKTFTDTKSAVGQIANHITDHAISQDAGLYLNKRAPGGLVVPNYLGVGKFVGEGSEKATSLSNVYDTDGNRIAETLDVFLTANVDAAKDPYITDGNFTLFTNDVAMLMARAGVPRQMIVDFIGTGSIRTYANVVSQYKGKTSEKHRIKGVGELTELQYVTHRYSKLLPKDAEGNSQSTTEIESATKLSEIDVEKTIKALGDNPTAQDQLNALRLFTEWSKSAEALSESIRASKADVSGLGSSIISAQIRANIKEKVIDDGLIGNFENKFNNTFLERFHENSVDAGRIMFGKNTFLHQTKGMKELMEDISKKIGMFPLTSEDIAFTLSAEGYAYLMSGTDYALSPTQLKDMFIGNDTLAKKLLLYKNNPTSPIKDNPLIQYLGVNMTEGEDAPNFIYGQGSKQLTTEAKNDITQAWKDLLEHDDSRVRDLAKEIGIYAYYSSGFRRNISSFHELIPVSLNQELGIPQAIKELQVNLEKGGHPMATATDQILKNLQDDSRIVPSLSKSPLRKLRNDLPVEKGFGVIPSTNSWLVAGTDFEGNPVMKPYLQYNDTLYRYVGLGVKKDQQGEGVIKETMLGVYVPDSSLGIKEGRFRVKEYYKNLSDMPSVFPQNEVDVDKRVSDIVDGLDVMYNEVDYSGGKDSMSPVVERMQPSDSFDHKEYIAGALSNIPGITSEEIERYAGQYNPDTYKINPDEYIDSVADIIKCS